MTWDPITYLLHRADQLERDNQILRSEIQRVDHKTRTTFSAHHSRIGSLEHWRKSIQRTTGRWPIALLILMIGVGLNVAPTETVAFLGAIVKVIL